jgi:hypothetical protein
MVASRVERVKQPKTVDEDHGSYLESSDFGGSRLIQQYHGGIRSSSSEEVFNNSLTEDCTVYKDLI